MTITITEQAKRRLAALCHLHGRNLVRFAVTSRGCGGYGYHMDFADGVNIDDEVVAITEQQRIVVDTGSMRSLNGTTIDWVENGLESRFMFDNPLADHHCGCGESFTIAGRP